MPEKSAEVGVNPARAGMIREDAASLIVLKGKPRASGDDPVTLEIANLHSA